MGWHLEHILFPHSYNLALAIGQVSQDGNVRPHRARINYHHWYKEGNDVYSIAPKSVEALRDIYITNLKLTVNKYLVFVQKLFHNLKLVKVMNTLKVFNLILTCYIFFSAKGPFPK